MCLSEQLLNKNLILYYIIKPVHVAQGSKHKGMKEQTNYIIKL